MRYHWGLGVGHLHAPRPASTSESCISDEPRDAELEEDQYADLEIDEDSESARSPDADGAVDMYDSDNPELGLDDRDLEGWQDVETDTSGSDVDDPNGEHESESEEDFVGM
jgi:hypothetical protein